jgi:hypothetical protein
MKTRLIVKPIFKRSNGYWWAYSQVRPNRIYSLHTRDGAKAQREYDRQVSELRRYIEEDEK